MGYIVTNWLSILAATLAGLLVGLADYLWRGRGGDYGGELTSPRPALLLPLAFAAEFWLAAILAGALILAPVQASPWVIALGTAVIIWIGFVLPVLLVTTVFVRRRLRDGALDCAHWLVVMLLQAAVLQAIGLIRPA